MRSTYQSLVEGVVETATRGGSHEKQKPKPKPKPKHRQRACTLVNVNERVLDVRGALQALVAAQRKTFVPADVGLSASQSAQLAELRVDEEESFEHYGKPSMPGKALRGLARFLAGLGANDVILARDVAQTVSDIVRDVVRAFGEEAAWVTIRASAGGDIWRVPRWHADGTYFPNVRSQCKFLIALKGANTRLAEFPDRLARRAFEDKSRERGVTMRQLDAHVRRHASRVCEDVTSVDGGRAGTGIGVVTLVGDDPRATIHSEPHITRQRLFMSIVPGSITDVAALRIRFLM